jgi:hypothetical protein
VKAAAMAWMAGRQGRDGLQARCLREKRARKRRARGEDSLVRVLRRVRTVGSSSVGGGEVAEGAMIVFVVFGRWLWLWCGEIYLREISPLAGSIPGVVLPRYWLQLFGIQKRHRTSSANIYLMER